MALSTWHCRLAAQESASPVHSDNAQPDERILLPAGTEISVRIADRVDTNHLHSGDLLTGIVDPSLMYNERVVIPRGTEAHCGWWRRRRVVMCMERLRCRSN